MSLTDKQNLIYAKSELLEKVITGITELRMTYFILFNFNKLCWATFKTVFYHVSSQNVEQIFVSHTKKEEKQSLINI